MGEEFWLRWQQNEFFQFLRSQKVTNDVFWCAQVLFQVFVETSAAMQAQNAAAAAAAAQSTADGVSPKSMSACDDAVPGVHPAHAQESSAVQNPFKLMGGLRLLIIEDSTAQRKIMMKRLQMASLQKHKKEEDLWVMGSAGSGEEALSMIDGGPQAFDIIIVDENLGGAGGELMGHEVCQDLLAMSIIIAYYNI